MKQFLISIAALFVTLTALTQTRYLSVAAFNTQSAMPFGKFAGLFSGPLHPGAEFGYGRNVSSKLKHEWFLELKIAYFFHRYVQHGIPVYLSFGYRYKINSRISAETSIGAGYMHSVPATAKLKLNKDGEYVNNKAVGRMQAMATYGIGLGYTFHPSVKRPITIFTDYQQRIQMPFVKSYVTLLPYNSFMIGIKKTIQ